jgi:hypothetical protein
MKWQGAGQAAQQTQGDGALSRVQKVFKAKKRR